jgi:hypothetical protein
MVTFNKFKSILKYMKSHEYILLTLWIAIMLVVFVPSVTADVSSLGTIKQGSCIEIPQVCASCTYVNYSVQYPNKSIAISNQAMTPNGAGLWTYNFCNTSQLGRYDVTGLGDLNGVDTGFSVLWFEVSTDGLSGKLGFTILILVLSLGVIVLGLWKQDAIVTILGSFGLYFIGLNILFYGLDGFKDPVYTWAFGLITLGIAFYVSVRSAWELIID